MDASVAEFDEGFQAAELRSRSVRINRFISSAASTASLMTKIQKEAKADDRGGRREPDSRGRMAAWRLRCLAFEHVIGRAAVTAELIR